MKNKKVFAQNLLCAPLFISNIEHGVGVTNATPKNIRSHAKLNEKNKIKTDTKIVSQVYYCTKIDVIISRVNFFQQITRFY